MDADAVADDHEGVVLAAAAVIDLKAGFERHPIKVKGGQTAFKGSLFGVG